MSRIENGEVDAILADMKQAWEAFIAELSYQ